MSYFGTIQGIETLIPLETLRKERPELGLPEFVYCDAGEFMMGGVKFDSEMPVHNVRISAPFWIGKYAVTQKQFLSVMGTNPAACQDDLENPVEQVTWDEAVFTDPCHRWRMETGIELIHKEPTKDEFLRIVENWKLMDEVQKRISDAKSKELFGEDNMSHARQLLRCYCLPTSSTALLNRSAAFSF